MACTAVSFLTYYKEIGVLGLPGGETVEGKAEKASLVFMLTG
jgi:hypothetical protein